MRKYSLLRQRVLAHFSTRFAGIKALRPYVQAVGYSPTLFFCDGANRETIVTVAVVTRTDLAMVEEESIGVVVGGGE